MGPLFNYWITRPSPHACSRETCHIRAAMVAPEVLNSEDPLAEVEAARKVQRAPVEGLPVFHGGLVGYFGYDVVRYVETKLEHP